MTRRPADPDAAAARSRRRFARRQWRRRWLAWKRVGLVLLVLAVLGGAVYLVWFSALLSVRQVQVRGAEVLTVQEVREAAAIPTGEALASVDLPAVEARVEALAAVREAEVARGWPDEVEVVIHEREAVAVVDLGGRLRGMDEDGVLFRVYASPPADLPRVQAVGVIDAEALAEGAQVVGSLPPELLARVDRVQVGTVDRIALVLREGRRVVWGSAEDSDLKAEVLGALLRRPARVYDVSAPGRPTTRG